MNEGNAMQHTKHRGVLATLAPRPRHLVGVLSMAMIAALFALVLAPAASAAAPPAPYVNGFENAGDAITGVTADNQAMFDVTRVSSGTDGINSASGAFYAQAAHNDYNTGTLNQFTRLGGYSSTFPVGGFTTSVDVYLDMSLATGSNDQRFDWSSAIGDTAGNHRRDFIFSVGTSDLANQFVMSASNNAPGWPANPGRDPFTITNTGWYTLQYKFYDSGSGVLAVDMTVLNAAHALLHTWTLSDPTDIIGTTVGGNRYGWLVYTDFSTLALDNISRTSGTATLGTCPVAVTGTNPVVYMLLADCTTDQTIVVPQNAGGSVFDGNSHSITGIDPAGGHFLGAVIQAQAGSGATTVKNLTVTVSNLTDACDAGNDRLRGILFDGVSGSITNNTVKDLEQGTGGLSGCQEGNGIDVRNTAGSAPKPSVTIDHNTVTDYQKTGIIATLSTVATITNNTVTGDGPISYIAQNGIQVSFAATAKLVGNNVSLNNYSPAKVTACGLLIYKAGGVSGATKSGLAFIKADNNFHANEQDICNFGKGGTFSPTS
jgi:hypothetical protein